MSTTMIQLISCIVGSFGFGFYFHIRKKYIIIASLCSGITYIVFVFCQSINNSLFFSSFVASLVGAALSEIMARILKAPSTIFCIISVFPLIPGSCLYYSMSNVVDGNLKKAAYYGIDMLLYTLGISAGICIAGTICHLIKKIREFRRAQ